ncbi:glycoside hydrolase family 95 protein [Paenibacillus daejeonensis]|uniref:glycoside hydrolase family 95 protein n=1 Tax=Paenibacillus daejeonensis TaxID=135193 RepID=UPI00036CF298|nr:glycoside hydrolase family 95 protein [Paenibacillus daejeonensis]
MRNGIKLWYNTPGHSWKQGLPIGNGRLGAVIYGGGDRETWSITELTYWSGKRERIAASGRGKSGLQEMRAAFFRGDYEEGDQLAKRDLQPAKQNFGTNLTVCNVQLRFPQAGDSLLRTLDLEEAVASMSYRASGTPGTHYTREAFASHPAGVVVSRLTADTPGGLGFELTLEGLTSRFLAVPTGEDTIAFEGQALEDIHSDGTCGVTCKGLLRIAARGGSVRRGAAGLIVRDADEVVIILALNTDYGQSDERWQERSETQVDAALAKGYDQLRAEHIDDYRALYDRVSLQLEAPDQAALPTDERLRRLGATPGGDPELSVLFFQYGRYLTIAGARADSPLPLHLQGAWNDGEANRMAWSCDYHLDINTQMNYFPVEIANLADSHLPLMRYIEQLAIAGRQTATDFYECEGWVAHVFSNAWGFTAPGWETGWGLNVTGGLWIAMHLKEHYEYSRDRDFLMNIAYPVLREAACFFLDYMTVHPQKGWLVTGPSNSPENSFYPPERRQGQQALSMGPTMDQVLVRELFEFCVQSSRLLETDEELQERLRLAIGQLPPLQIGAKGQLQEWLEDYEEAQPDHRHLAHLYALYPAAQITPLTNPQLSEAARQTLLRRMTDELEDIEFTAVLFATGFSRLYDGDRALRHVEHLISELCFDNLLTYSKAGIAGAETNIFVIDGNYGGTAAVADMLLQSQTGEVHMLPALPSEWQAGSFRGLRARGGLEVDAGWAEGKLLTAAVRAHVSGSFTIRYGDQTVTIQLEAGQSCELDGGLQWRIRQHA